MEEIFSGDFYQVQAKITSDGPTAICFDPWLNKQDPARPPFGLRYFSSNNINVVSVKSHGNHWYQFAEMDEVIARINRRVTSRQRVGYGSSMGGYAAINFSERLSLTSVLLFAPQFSPDLAKVPWENRWREQEDLECRYDVVSEIAPIGGYIFFDPYNLNDRKHAALITQRHPLTPIKMPFSGHHALDWFGQNKTISQLIKSVIFDPGRQADAIHDRRRDRDKIANYWFNLSAHCLGKGRPVMALRAARRGLECERGDLVLARHSYAVCLYATGALEEAQLIWRTALANPAEMARQRFLLGQAIDQYGWKELRNALLNAELATLTGEAG